jgi:hypothetical protein
MAWYGDADPRERRAALEGAGGGRLLPFVFTVFFGILFAGIADLAWLTATGSTAPWFTSATSAQVYTSTLTTATLATLILASLAASKLAVLDARARSAAARELAAKPDEPDAPAEVPRPVVLAPKPMNRPEGLDQILSELERFAESPMVEVRDRESGRPIPRSLGRPRAGATGPGRKMPGATREALRKARALVWQTVAGPLAVFLVFISIAGAMLPGSGAFAQTHFQLNTGLILFLGYGWPFLVTWTVASIVLLHILVRGESFEAIAPAAMPRTNGRSEPSRRAGMMR